MRISDWRSDVCSSDLSRRHIDRRGRRIHEHARAAADPRTMERARAHIGRAAEQHQTRFATRLAPGVRLPRDQPDGAKADMPPACTFGCDVQQGAVAGRWVRFDEGGHVATLQGPSRAAKPGRAYGWETQGTED